MHRVSWVDSLKGVTVVLVALFHSYLAFETLQFTGDLQRLDELFKAATDRLGMARMPSFFLASGLVLAAVSGNKKIWFLKKRLPFMLWIISLWTLIQWCLEMSGLHLYPWQSYPYLSGYLPLIAPYGNIWFIYSILFLSGLAVALGSQLTFRKLVTLVLIYVLLSTLLAKVDFAHWIQYYTLHKTTHQGLPFFFVGFYLSRYVKDFFNSRLVLITAIPVCSIVYLVFNAIVEPGPGFSQSKILFHYLPSTIIFIAMIVFLDRVEFCKKLMHLLGKYSLEIFLSHQIFIAACYFFYSAILAQFEWTHSNPFIFLVPVFACCAFIFLFGQTLKPYVFSLPQNPTWLSKLSVKIAR